MSRQQQRVVRVYYIFNGKLGIVTTDATRAVQAHKQSLSYSSSDADQTGTTFADEPTTGPPPADDETSPLE